MKVGGLIEAMFRLPFEYATPALLFEQELRSYHHDLPARGLRLLDIEPAGIQRMVNLGRLYAGVSSSDLASLVLAEQLQVPLLTGDRKLRQVCLAEDLEVRGTVWLVGETIARDIVPVDVAEAAYQRMENDGSRLPWDEVERQLRRYR
jgi:predicted nucleic acid-binding protein